MNVRTAPYLRFRRTKRMRAVDELRLRLRNSICPILLLFLTAKVDGAPVTDENGAMNYLTQFGYLDSPPPSDIASPLIDLRAAIINFQRMASLPQTGVLDERTLGKMSLSRCGVPDFPQQADKRRRRRKRYVIGSSAWPTNKLTYSFRNYSAKLSKQLVRSIVAKALQMWANASGIAFTELTNTSSANIHLLYATRDHGDGYPFDGPGGVLAHTFYPNSGFWSGDSHFDDDETWTDGVNQGTNLLQVTTHELGHALGLGHSSDPNSVMQPFYGGYMANFQLGQDDINGIQYLYGGYKSQPVTVASPVTTAVTVTTQSSMLPSDAMCHNATVDAIVAVNKTIYVFSGSRYWILDAVSCCIQTPTIRAGFPRQLSDDWPGLGVSYVDDALYMDPTSTSSGHLYIFSGQYYWRYSNLPSNTIDSGYPRNISSGFPGVPDNIDAAFIWGKNNRTYFIKGSQYYRYIDKQSVDQRYPKPVSLWTGLPAGQRITAAFRSPDMKTVFFSAASFYQFDDVAFQAGLPRSTARYLFNCTVS